MDIIVVVLIATALVFSVWPTPERSSIGRIVSNADTCRYDFQFTQPGANSMRTLKVDSDVGEREVTYIDGLLLGLPGLERLYFNGNSHLPIKLFDGDLEPDFISVDYLKRSRLHFPVESLDDYFNASEYAIKDIQNRSPPLLKGSKATTHPACHHRHWEYYVMLGVWSSSLLVFVSVFSVVYRYRHDLLFWWVIKRARGRPYRIMEDGQDFDAFLSYSNVEGELAVSIHTHIETGLEREYRVAIDGRDFVPGEYLTENIANLIARSSKVIFLISHSFLAGKWTTYELRMGEYRCFEAKRNLMILVFLEEIPDKDLPRTLRALKRHVNYLVYPPADDRRATDVFWKRLQLGLNKRG